MLRFIFTSLTILTLCSCASVPSPRVMSELQQGKRDFDAGYYKTAMREMLPLACDGNAEAQYAVGYMYYYGYGVTQDTDTGAFWIERAAKQGNKAATAAMKMIAKEK